MKKLLLVLLIGIGMPQLAWSQTISCPPGGSITNDRNQRIEGFGFSVLPPSAGTWCQNTPGPRMLGFSTNKFVGTVVEGGSSREEMFHSFAISVNAIGIRQADVDRYSTLQEFIEAWTEAGGRGIDSIGSGIYADLSRLQNFTAIANNVVVEATLDADCVRYESVLEERENPTVPRRWVLTMMAEGLVCRHPDDENLLIDVAFTERLRQGWTEPTAGLRQRFWQQAQATLSSLRFESIEPLTGANEIEISRGMPLVPGEAVTGSLTANSPLLNDRTFYESWTFEGEAGDRIRISMATDNFDAVVVLGRNLAEGFSMLAADDDSGRRSNARLDYTLPADGEYTIVANSFAPGAVGDYSLQLEFR